MSMQDVGGSYDGHSIWRQDAKFCRTRCSSGRSRCHPTAPSKRGTGPSLPRLLKSISPIHSPIFHQNQPHLTVPSSCIASNVERCFPGQEADSAILSLLITIFSSQYPPLQSQHRYLHFLLHQEAPPPPFSGFSIVWKAQVIDSLRFFHRTQCVTFLQDRQIHLQFCC